MLLEPQAYLEGGQACTVWIRPRRLAFVVPDDSMEVTRRVIEANCLLWGGLYNLIVPHSQRRGITDEWATFIRFHDPDTIVDCVGLGEEEVQAFRDLRRFVTKWHGAKGQFPRMVCPIHSILQAAAGKNRQHFVVVGSVDEGDPMYLPALARYGRLNEEGFEDVLEVAGYPRSLRYKDLMPVLEGCWHETAGLIAGYPPSPMQPLRSGGQHTYSSPLQMAGRLVPVQMPSYTFGGGSPERPQFDEAYVEEVIITGRRDSIPDLCLFWALRQQRPYSDPFPLWIPLKVLGTDEGRRALEIARRPRGRVPVRSKGMHVLSLSARPSEVKHALKRAGVVAEVRTRGLERFFSPDFRTGFREEMELRFERGRTWLRIPDAEVLRELRGLENVTVETETPSFRLPQVDMTFRLFGKVLRVSRRGIVSQVEVYKRHQLVDLSLPSAWSCLESVFEAGGFVCEPSDKGRLAVSVIKLLGGIEYLQVLASSRIYELLERMSTSRARTTGDAVRPPFQLSDAKEIVGRTGHTEVILRWLLKRGIISRGTIICCPNCELRKWYSFERLGPDRFRCEGCFEEMTIPLEVDVTQWSYKINELVAKAFEQGVLPHLLTIVASWYPSPVISGGRTLGFHPGIRIGWREDARERDEGFGDMEIDFVELFEGRLIIGECKVDANSMDYGALRRYTRLANRLNCSRIIVSSCTALGEEATALMDKAKSETRAAVEVIDCNGIMDRTWSERVREEEVADSEGAAKAYLDHLAKYYMS